MSTYISILRGINVSGKRKILMGDLRSLYQELGFTRVATYIQSGNVVFDCGEKASAVLCDRIAGKILETYGFPVPVLIRSLHEMRQILSQNPFLKAGDSHTEKMHVTFLSELPDPERLEPLLRVDHAPDQFVVLDKEVFLYIPGSYGMTKLSNKFWEDKLRVAATTRNFHTVSRLVEIASDKAR